MVTEQILRMVFRSTEGTRKTITVPDCKDDVDAAAVNAFANALLTTNVVTDANGNNLSEIESAVMIKTEETEIPLQRIGVRGQGVVFYSL